MDRRSAFATLDSLGALFRREGRARDYAVGTYHSGNMRDGYGLFLRTDLQVGQGVATLARKVGERIPRASAGLERIAVVAAEQSLSIPSGPAVLSARLFDEHDLLVVEYSDAKLYQGFEERLSDIAAKAHVRYVPHKSGAVHLR